MPIGISNIRTAGVRRIDSDVQILHHKSIKNAHHIIAVAVTSLPNFPENKDSGNISALLNDEKSGFFDKETMMFHAQKPGNVKILAKLARKQASFPIIIKPNVVDYTLSVINESDDHIQEIRKGGEDQSVEYIRCYIATFLRFKLERHPENAINSPIAIEFTDGISIEKNAEENGFVVNTRRVGKGETIKINLPGCNIVKTIIIDIIPNPGNLSKDNRSATLIAATVATTLLLVLGAFFLAPKNIYLLAFGFLVIVFDGYAIYKAEKNIKYILILFTIIAITALGFSICKDFIKRNTSTLYYLPYNRPREPRPVLPTQPPTPTPQEGPIQPVSQPDKELPRDSNPIKQKDLDHEMEEFAEENCSESFEAYTKAKRSIRNRRIIYNKAKNDGATQARLNQLLNEINEAILKFNDARQQIINIYNSKNK